LNSLAGVAKAFFVENFNTAEGSYGEYKPYKRRDKKKESYNTSK